MLQSWFTTLPQNFMIRSVDNVSNISGGMPSLRISSRFRHLVPIVLPILLFCDSDLPNSDSEQCACSLASLLPLLFAGRASRLLSYVQSPPADLRTKGSSTWPSLSGCNQSVKVKPLASVSPSYFEDSDIVLWSYMKFGSNFWSRMIAPRFSRTRVVHCFAYQSRIQ